MPLELGSTTVSGLTVTYAPVLGITCTLATTGLRKDRVITIWAVPGSLKGV